MLHSSLPGPFLQQTELMEVPEPFALRPFFFFFSGFQHLALIQIFLCIRVLWDVGPGRAILAVGMGISKADFNPSPSRRQCSDVDAGNRNGPFPHKAMLEIHGPLTVPAACQSRGVSPYQNKSTALHGQG